MSTTEYMRFAQPRGVLATASDLAAFRLSMIAPVKKSVNHSRTVASMRETAENNIKKFVFAAIRQCEVNSLLVLLVIAFFTVTIFSPGNVELSFPFFWSCVCHYMRFSTPRTRPVNIDRKQSLF